jgi:hypothetical protein
MSHTNTLKAATVTLWASMTLAAPIVFPAAAQAEPSDMFQFLSPSGNIACHMDDRADGTGYAWCKVQDHAWAAPASGYCEAGHLPGAIGEPGGEDLQLSQGSAPCLGFVMSQIFFTGEYAPAALGYGQSHTVGTITCESAPSGVTCTDSGTGHFFQVSRDAYQLG